MNAHHTIARLREERDDLQEQVRCLTEELAEILGQGLHNVPGMTPLESRIFRCLEAANGRIVSKDALMGAMYFDKAGEPPDSKIVAVYICKIRKIIADAGARIRNKYAEGYVLEPAP